MAREQTHQTELINGRSFKPLSLQWFVIQKMICRQMHQGLVRKAKMVPVFLCAITARGHTVSPPNSYVEVLVLVPLNVTVFGDRVFKEVIKEK